MAVCPRCHCGETAISLCDGYGGFSLALREFGVRTVCRVERDSYAAAILVERMEQARLDPCPLWDDIETFDGAAWRGRVDWVTAGFPCPDFSSAGRRAGVDGVHWLWPEVFKIICDVGPRYVVLENVPGLVRLGGLTRVLSDLASIGFDAEWGVYAAQDVGAPHRRERIWIVAYTNRQRLSEVGRFDIFGCDVDRRDADVADTAESRRGERFDGTFVTGLASDTQAGSADNVADAVGGDCRTWSEGESAPSRRSERALIGTDTLGTRTAMEHTDCPRCEGLRPAGAPRRGIVGPANHWPPLRDDTERWWHWIADGGPEPVLRRDADGPPNGLADALHLGGNGLVPQAAAEAIRQLCARAGWVLT